MLPIALLMIEHRLMDRMIDLIKGELRKTQEGKVDLDFIDGVVDFFTTYVDLCHHRKEEAILFQNLGRKEISPEHKKIMNELMEEHVLARKVVERLDSEKGRYGKDRNALQEMENCLKELSELSPSHIEKEDRHFFVPSMTYFNKQEKDDMLSEMEEFDKKLVHGIYTNIVEQFEKKTK